jgi:lysozyme
MIPLITAVAAIKGGELDTSEMDAISRALIACGLDPLPPSWVDPELFAVARAHLENEEGRVAHAYRDHLGYLTIGIGRLIDDRRGGRLLPSEIDLLLANDIAARVGAMRRWPAWRRVVGDPVRGAALLSMCFQLGVRGLGEFTTTLAHIAAGRFDEAADAMLDSLWAAQTPARAMRVAYMMRTGELP